MDSFAIQKDEKNTILVQVEELNPTHVNHHLLLRVVHVWTIPDWHDRIKIKTLEMVFVDEMGSTIQGSVKSDYVQQFRSILTDGVAIMLSNFQIGNSHGTFRYSDHKYKINFQPDTQVKLIDTYTGPLHHFDFRSFDEIIEHTLKDNQIIDIIGLVVAVGPTIAGFSSTNQANKRRVICLENTDGKQVDCTLWDGYVEQFNQFFERNNDEAPVVLIVQFGKVKGFSNGSLSFGSALYATKLYINEDIPAIQDFKDRMKAKHGSDSFVLKPPSVSSNTIMSSPSAFFASCVRTTLDELPRVSEEKRCATLATIHSVMKDKPWYYIACTKCQSGTKPITDSDSAGGGALNSLWRCKTCPNPVKNILPRYKVYVRVVDDTGSATFILFDKDIKKLITLNAQNLQGVVGEPGDQFPEEFDDLAGHKALFDYKVTKYWNLDQGKQEYTVNKLTKEESVTDAFRKLAGTDVDNVSEHEPTTPLLGSAVGDNSHVVSKDATSAAGGSHTNVSVKSNAVSPPAKRFCIDLGDDDTIEGSSTRAPRNLFQVKQEKP